VRINLLAVCLVRAIFKDELMKLVLLLMKMWLVELIVGDGGERKLREWERRGFMVGGLRLVDGRRDRWLKINLIKPHTNLATVKAFETDALIFKALSQ
jgi:hypothetical protein